MMDRLKCSEYGGRSSRTDVLRFTHRCIQALARRSRLSLRANDSILTPMFAFIAEPKGELDISYLPFDLQVSPQRGKTDTANRSVIWNPQPSISHLRSFVITSITIKKKECKFFFKRRSEDNFGNECEIDYVKLTMREYSVNSQVRCIE